MSNFLDNVKNTFNFNGRELCYEAVREWERVKYYKESDHFDRALVKDDLGNLYLYEFYEYVNFGGSDEIYQTYVPVASEAEAEQLNSLPDIKVKGCFMFGPETVKVYSDN